MCLYVTPVCCLKLYDRRICSFTCAWEKDWELPTSSHNFSCCCLLYPPKHLWYTAVATVFVSFFSKLKILFRLQICNYFSHSASLLTTPHAREELFLHQGMFFSNGSVLYFSVREAETTKWFLFTFVTKQQHSALTVERLLAVLQDALLHLQFVQQKFTHSFTNHYCCVCYN